MDNTQVADSPDHPTSGTSSGSPPSVKGRSSGSSDSSKPGFFIKTTRALFGYRKTSLTALVLITAILTYVVVTIEQSLTYSVTLPRSKFEKSILESSWLDLQEIGREQHPYDSRGNDRVHDYLEIRINEFVNKKPYIIFDNDLNYTNNIMYRGAAARNFNDVTYYESNNLLVKVEGKNKDLPALLLSAHFDSVPTGFGVTDDGMGIASLLGILNYFSSDDIGQPLRTIIFNFNNNEEFGLCGAQAFITHPWFSEVGYFLNLEGAGCGGKAVLFRGTDYDVVKHFNEVRYPFASSLFQQAFNNLLVHSDTDYTVYKRNGLRGLDLAFFAPRDIYHTPGDNIKNIKIESLWHMLSNGIDYSLALSSKLIGFETDLSGSTSENPVDNDVAVFASFFNYFFSIPISRLVLLNLALILLIPVINIPFLIIVFKYKRNWRIGFYNFIKVPLSLAFSSVVVSFFANYVVITMNEFLPSSGSDLALMTFFTLALLSNYIFLNGMNLIFKKHKSINHDEKLVSIIQISALYWILLLYSTIKLSHNRVGDDHSGELFVPMLVLIQSLGAFLGLLGWSLQGRSKMVCSIAEENEPLISSNDSSYGASDENGASERNNIQTHAFTKRSVKKHHGYDWFAEYFVITPLSSLILYYTINLLLSGLTKSIQESLKSENLIYSVLEYSSIFLTLPLIPFTFKFNRILVGLITIFFLVGLTNIFIKNPFNEANPLKLRVLEQINLDVSKNESNVFVYGRMNTPINSVINDLPSVKKNNIVPQCSMLQDGMVECSYKSILAPQLAPNFSSFDDYLNIEMIRNSSSSSSHPFTLLSGEIKIHSPNSRMCSIDLLNPKTSEKYLSQESPVKLVTVYNEHQKNTSYISRQTSSAIPDGFSQDSEGNYIYKDVEGVSQLTLNKLNWQSSFHVSFEWVPSFLVSQGHQTDIFDESNEIKLNIKCFWADLGYPSEGTNYQNSIPSYDELLRYSPKYISWANRDRGLVSVSKSVSI
ncbi:Piso0_002631 [Millerozyma farinosa CBS 7064]|uniref:Peptide hydrolase n=1 Tax=Pichia sorbitophila (strain ATCC MYA-4447 / BCRC 22081 / CBS 7064 / NBRC 10061 / NRRL Y-12695) TaxID=559304 RepID=G8YD45_PICSO|nr:Piso0_002631 [Millerozyma farinosa CBS 7064]